MIAKEAVEILKANYPDACFGQLRDAVDMAIKALEQPEQQWIPCSEQLPKEGREVIIWLKEKDLLGKNMRMAHLGYHSAEDKNFKYLGEVLVWYCERYYCSLNDVIAWMPRPKPYKE